MNYNVERDDQLGRHIVFDQPVEEATFIAACGVAIDLAARLFEEELAVNFIASGVPVQVVRSDDPTVQLALWRRKLSTAKALT